MVLFGKSEIEHKHVLRIIKTGGYLVLVGMSIGLILGVYTQLYNPPLFSIFINISYYESRFFFLGVYLPSFVTVVAIGYVFATMPRLERFSLWYVAVLCSIVLLSLALSALSIFNIFSFLGGIIILIALIFHHTKPTFRVLWRRETCFFAEAGAILIACSSLLFLLMHLVSGFLQTYSAGVYEASYVYPYLLLLITTLSFLTFLGTPFLCLHGANMGLCGIIELAMGILSFITFSRNQYVYTSLSACQGLFLAGAGIIFTFLGALLNFKLFLSEVVLTPTFEPSSLYKGKYCPSCGASWKDVNKVVCSKCGSNLLLKSEKSFCPYCGRLMPKDIGNCPHCGEYVESLPVYISPIRREMPIKKPKKLQKAINFVSKPLGKIVGKTGESLITFKEFVYVAILTFLFVFLSFILYIRTVSVGQDEEGLLLFSVHYGFPMEWLEVLTTVRYVIRVNVIWITLILDFILYFLLSFAIVYGSKKLYKLI